MKESTKQQTTTSDGQACDTESAVESPQAPTRVPLSEDIKRGWEWVVYVWRMIRRLGGPIEVSRTAYLIISMMAKRTLVQWGWIKRQ